MEEEEEEEEKAKEEKANVEKEEEEQEFGSNLSIPPLPGSHPVQASGVPSPSSLCPTLKIRDSRWKPSGQKRETTQDIQTSANTDGKEFSVNSLFMTLLQIWNKKLRK